MTIAFILRDWTSIGGIQRMAQNVCDGINNQAHTVVKISTVQGLFRHRNCDIVFIGHIHLLPLAWIIRPSTLVILLIYGIEAWRPLTVWQRVGLWRVNRVWAISQYSWNQAKPYLGDKPVWILPPTASVS